LTEMLLNPTEGTSAEAAAQLSALSDVYVGA
jgi:hypothetical protein